MMSYFSYPSKILLFGEYTVLLGSKALAIPNPQYYGYLDLFDMYNTDCTVKFKKSNNVLKELLGYLKENNKISPFLNTFNINKFDDDIKSGLFFRSNIPEGSGLGSSGALVAAVYHKYFLNSGLSDFDDITNTRKNLAFIESFFHHNSSGVDPLISILNKPLLLENGNEFVIITDETKQLNNTFTLVNSNVQRTTANLVEGFRQKLEDKTFKKAVEEILIPLNNTCIEAFMQNDEDKLFEQLFKLSEFQLQNMEWLIPGSMQQIWKEGLDNGNLYKLCGAGGGGFFLKFNKISGLTPLKLSIV